MIWVWSAWALWVFVALFTLVQWSITFSHSDRGVRILAGRAAFLLSAALGVTAFTTFPKWHLLWMAPLAYFGSTMVSIMLMSRNAERSLKAWRRNEIATWNPAMVPVVGEDVAWKEIVRQVLHVLEFDRGETIINPDGSLKRASLMEPDGHLLVKSPIFYRPIKVPIVHRDDFLLA